MERSPSKRAHHSDWDGQQGGQDGAQMGGGVARNGAGQGGQGGPRLLCMLCLAATPQTALRQPLAMQATPSLTA